MQHLNDLLKKANDASSKEQIQEVINKVEDNKFKYTKRSKEEIRDLFYEHGVSVRYVTRDKHQIIIKDDVVRYKMLYRNSSKAKIGQVMFINEKLYNVAYNWLTMGLGKRMGTDNAKIVEMSAYAPLTTSTIEGTFYVPVEDVLILKDQKSAFFTTANIVRGEEYEGFERTVDEEKTTKAKNKAIEKGNIDILGNPIYKTVYKRVPVKKNKCVVNLENTCVANTLWDGMGLIESSVLPKWVNGMALLRNHFFKICGFRSNIQQFFKDWCNENNYDYETYEVKDMFGVYHKLKDIKIITTNNAIKWLKFKELMGNNITEAYQYWCDRINRDGSIWGIVKTDHESKLGDVQQMSYQMINSLPCTSQDIKDIAQSSIDYVELLKTDNDEFENFLRKNANEINHFQMMADLYKHNPGFADSLWFRTEKRKVINQYVSKLRGGKITVNGDNLTLCGNPYGLLLHAVGEDWSKDPTLQKEDNCIQCNTSRFKDGEYLCGFRSPHNSPNNCVYLHNTKNKLIDKYFNFSSNIIAVNCINTDIQPRLNGADFDSDFSFVTNHPTLVECAKKCYLEYPTIVNELQESGITYKNIPLEYALMDNRFAKSRRGIGESSNLAQLALTYYWTELAKDNPDQNKLNDLYNNFVILSVLAQVVIDGSKREYEVDALSEIDRIKNMDCMQIRVNDHRKDLPFFMRYTKDIPTTKNGKDLPYEDVCLNINQLKKRINSHLDCPMNWLQDWLDKIQGANKTNTLPTKLFFIKMDGKANDRQMTKIRKLVEKYDNFIKLNHERLFNDDFIHVFREVSEEFYNKISKIKINNIITINRLIETCLSIDEANNNKNFNLHEGAKHSRRMLNTLYKTNKEKFLLNFAPKID